MTARVARLAIVLVALLAVIASCQGSEDPPQPTPTNCRGAGCYDIPFINAPYCEVQGIRQLVRDGLLKSSELPSDADMTTRDGAPLIVDFRDPANTPKAVTRYLDRTLGPAVAKAGASVNRRKQRECASTLTQESIERTQGGPFGADS